MSIQMKKIFNETIKIYQLTLLAGKSGLDNEIVWVQYVEDIATSNFLRGNELIITTGLCSNGKVWIMDFIRKLIARKASGIIINIGKYIQVEDIDGDVISLCEKKNFPLLTMPWRIHLSDIMQDYLDRLFLAAQTDNEITEMVRQAIFKPEKFMAEIKNSKINNLMDNRSFHIMVFNYPAIISEKIHVEILLHNKKLLNQIQKKYVAFWQKNLLIIIVSESDKDNLQKIIAECDNFQYRLLHKSEIPCGVSSKHKENSSFNEAFNEAVAAICVASLYNVNTLFFDDLGVYRVLFATNNNNMLKKIHDTLLSVVIEYDEKHKAQLYNTLRIYLFNNSSLQTTAKITFTHRNTINYRITKIRHLLDCDLDNAVVRFNLMMAFYISDYLRIIDMNLHS